MRGCFQPRLVVVLAFLLFSLTVGQARADLEWTELGFPMKFNGESVRLEGHRGELYLFTHPVLYNRRSGVPYPEPTAYRLHRGSWKRFQTPKISQFFEFQGKLHVQGDSWYRMEGKQREVIAPALGIIEGLLATENDLYVVLKRSKRISVRRLVDKAWADVGGKLADTVTMARIESYQGDLYAICDERNTSIHLRKLESGRWSRVADLYRSEKKVKPNQGFLTNSKLTVFNGKLLALVQVGATTRLFPDVLGQPDKFLTSKGAGPYVTELGPKGKTLYFTTAIKRSFDRDNNPLWVAQFDGSGIQVGEPISMNFPSSTARHGMPGVSLKRVSGKLYLAFFQGKQGERHQAHLRVFKAIER